jgi:prepilin peptidase CpaA
VLFGVGVLLLGFLLFQINVFGGGDAKLIAAAAVWTGVAAFLEFALWTAIAGGFLAMFLLVTRARLKPSDARPAFLNRLLTGKGGVPYGVAILAGGLMALDGLPFARGPLTLP